MRQPARVRSRSLATTPAIALTLAVLISCLALLEPLAHSQGPASAKLTVSWPTGTTSIPANRAMTVKVRIAGGSAQRPVLVVTIGRGRLTTIPRACRASDVLHKESSISPARTQLTCTLPPLTPSGTKSVDVTLLADNLPGSRLYLTARLFNQSVPRSLPITAGSANPPYSFRFLSSPDFLNADVADLAGPDSGATWDPTVSENSTNDRQQVAMDTILGDWAAQDPDAVLVAGDLVNGHWGKDTDYTGNFGPVETFEEKQTALRRAAITYYPQWKRRFAAHGLQNVYPAMGDHEYGDDPWLLDWKRRLAPTFREEWARQFTKLPSGQPRFADRPVGSKHEFSAYAWRPHPRVQMVTLDVFDNLSAEMRVRLDAEQLTWLRGVLAKAQTDRVPWVIVQGHTPIVGPVRQSASSGLMFEGGASSGLWGVFKKYDVDLYLTGEVHAVTEVRRDGIVQISHGGLFSFAHTNHLIADVYANKMEITIRDFDGRWSNALGRLWETQMPGGPKDLAYRPNPPIIGTTTLWSDGRETGRSGALLPYTP